MAASRALTSRQLIWNTTTRTALPCILSRQQSLLVSRFSLSSQSSVQTVSGRKSSRREKQSAATGPKWERKDGARFGVGVVSAGDVADWTAIYRFQYIVLARAIQRIKLYQTGITCFVLLPLAQLSDQADLASAALAISALACTMLCVMGSFSSRLVGLVYVHNEDPTRLRLARLNFFGKRVDSVFRADAFVPITDSRCDPADVYVELQPVERPNLRSPWQRFLPMLFKDKYYLSLRFGTVLEEKRFISVFGDVSPFLRRNKDKA